MGWIKNLEPKNTEEIKPGLFMQKTMWGYREIKPAAWKGKVNWKNTILGPHWVRHLIFFAILMLLVWGYQEDTKNLREFYVSATQNPNLFCEEAQARSIAPQDYPSNFTFNLSTSQ